MGDEEDGEVELLFRGMTFCKISRCTTTSSAVVGSSMSSSGLRAMAWRSPAAGMPPENWCGWSLTGSQVNVDDLQQLLGALESLHSGSCLPGCGPEHVAELLLHAQHGVETHSWRTGTPRSPGASGSCAVALVVEAEDVLPARQDLAAALM